MRSKRLKVFLTFIKKITINKNYKFINKALKNNLLLKNTNFYKKNDQHVFNNDNSLYFSKLYKNPKIKYILNKRKNNKNISFIRSLLLPRHVVLYVQNNPLTQFSVATSLKLSMFNRVCANINSKY